MIDTREAIFFKQVPEGYVFRAPKPWLFGRSRFFLVDEAQKQELLAILTARSPIAIALIFMAVTLLSIGLLTVAAVLLVAEHGSAMASFLASAALTPVLMYGAFLLAAGPAARRVQPLLARLAPTDQRISRADIGKAMQRNPMSLPAHFMGVAAQGLVAAALLVQAILKAGTPSFLGNASLVIAALAWVCFVMSSISFASAVVKKRRNKQEIAPAAKSINQTTTMTVGVAFLLLITATTILSTYMTRLDQQRNALAAQHRAESFEISKRLSALTERVQDRAYLKRQTSIQPRLTANADHLKALTGKLNNPAIKCDATADDLAACAERARREQQALEIEIETTRKEGQVLAKEKEALQKEKAAIMTELAEIRAASEANRAAMVANGELRPDR